MGSHALAAVAEGDDATGGGSAWERSGMSAIVSVAGAPGSTPAAADEARPRVITLFP
jgi:hypothetical protein